MSSSMMLTIATVRVMQYADALSALVARLVQAWPWLPSLAVALAVVATLAAARALRHPRPPLARPRSRPRHLRPSHP